MTVRHTGEAALKLEQFSLPATLALAFAALAALVLTGQAGIGENLRALQPDMPAGQAELRAEMRMGQAKLRNEIRAGQAELGQDLATLGVWLVVLEHRTDTLESRFAVTAPQSIEPCEGVDCPGS